MSIPRHGFWFSFFLFCSVLLSTPAITIPGEVFLTELIKNNLTNPSLTLPIMADNIPPKIYPVHIRFRGVTCRTCRYEINRAWINGKELRFGNASWQFEGLSGESPYLLKISLDEIRRGKVHRNRTLYGDLTGRPFANIISLDLAVP